LAGGAASLAGISMTLNAVEAHRPTQADPSAPPAKPADKEAGHGFRVAAGDDRVKEHRKLFDDRPIPLDIKVSTRDSGGGMLIVEHTDVKKSGPPRHIHHDQDEWFYVVKGDYIVEVGGEKFVLGPGDSVLGPRKIPHAWAFVGEGTGKLIITFQPAGKMEAFFNKIAPMTEFPPRDEMERMFRDHGLELTGPPLLAG
jgi:quercetin dioxygenase-like cupin family protein